VLKRGSLIAACQLAVVVGVVRAEAPIATRLAVTEALNTYERGAYDAFAQATRADGAVTSDLFPTFDREATRWIQAGSPPTRTRRILVAATVALELAHLLEDRPSWYAGEYLTWASKLMAGAPSAPASNVERLWYLASIAGMEAVDTPWIFKWGESGRPTDHVIGPGGHVTRALQRFPDEPRFQLARVQTLELRFVSEFYLAQGFLAPSWRRFLEASAAAPVPSDPRSFDERTLIANRDMARQMLSQYGKIPEIVGTWEALGVHPSLRAEIELHAGYWEAAAMRWPQALARLRRVPALTDDVFLRFLSHYFQGQVLHDMGDRLGAVDALSEAQRIFPNAESAATLLAAELLLSDRGGDRDQVYPLLSAAYSGDAPTDPWRLFRHGDARLWSVYMAALREALR
jgi:tetratricopeptide (TPR) repeat protein